MNVAQGTMGEVFGSPHYISPEQAQNSAQAVPQSDLYSLGVMVYEMLTGFVPFDDPSPAALAYQHISQPPPAPRALNPQIPAAVESVLLKALRKAPQERYQTGRDLVAALAEAFGAGVEATRTQAPAARSAAGSPAVPTAQGGNAGRRGNASRWLTGCALALITVGLLGGILAANAGLVRGLFVPVSPTTAIQAVRPNATVIPKTLAPAAPSALPPSITPAPSATDSPTPTSTPAPSATPAAANVQFLIPAHTAALLVINQSDTSLPLANLHLRSGTSQIQGDVWNAINLQKGECAVVLSDPKEASRVENLPCKLAHDPLRWTGGAAFWTKSFDILYLDQKVGACTRLAERENSCTANFSQPAPTETPRAPYPS
jgi:hypothetical protein